MTLEPINLEDKTVTPTEEQLVVISDTADGLNSVTIEPIPDEYIKPTGTKEITENGTYDVSNYAETKVSIGGGIDDYIDIEQQLTSGGFYQYYIKKVPSIDVSKYTNLSSFFQNFYSLEEIGILNLESCIEIYSFCNGCKKLTTIKGLKNTQNITNWYSAFRETAFETAPELDTSNAQRVHSLYYRCPNLKTLPLYDFGNVTQVDNILYGCPKIANLAGFKDLGKAYSTITSANSSSAVLDLSPSTQYTHDSLMNVINYLYDLNLTYDVANGGTLRSQKLVLGSTNMGKLTSAEIAIATNKGWVVS